MTGIVVVILSKRLCIFLDEENQAYKCFIGLSVPNSYASRLSKLVYNWIMFICSHNLFCLDTKIVLLR
jgi:hypothetical protein